MGKVLIIKGADFSQNAIIVTKDVVIEQGIITLLMNQNAGVYNPSPTEANWTKRIRTVNTGLIYIESGQKCVVSGLQGSGNVPALRLDAAIYSSSENPSHSTFLHTLNGDSTDYYKFNGDGSDSFTFTAPHTGYYALCFAATDKTSQITPSNYTIKIGIS